MSEATTSKLEVGTVVKYRHPADPDEAAARFDLVEHREERVLIRLRCDLPIPPTEVVAVGEVAAAE